MNEADLPHSCQWMDMAVSDERIPLEYIPKFREFNMVLKGGVALQNVDFCPGCGVELPSSLRDEFFDRLDGLDLEIDSPELPAEFLDDAWWRP